jgi:hypothetical protein
MIALERELQSIFVTSGRGALGRGPGDAAPTFRRRIDTKPEARMTSNPVAPRHGKQAGACCVFVFIA